MILYKGTAAEFRDHVDTNKIADLIEEEYESKLGRTAPESERRSWINSLSSMEAVVRRSMVPDDCGILVEYVVPNTSNRIDFLISGKGKDGNKNLVIVELKQWQRAEMTEKEGVVSTVINGGVRETTHPSYQASSYKSLLMDFIEPVSDEVLFPYACAYLHNYSENVPEPLKHEHYVAEIKKAPLYLKDDTQKLENFLQTHVGGGDGEEILYELENGRIKPSKKLIDRVSAMFEGNQAFTLIDEQKVSFETAKDVALNTDEKSVVIIKGGPGTGKSVISVNLLGALLQEEQNTVFVAPNSAFREVMIDKLAQDRTKKRVKQLFKGSSNFVDTEKNMFDTIVVDEAHRLKDDSAFMYQGKNQVYDIVKSAKTTIFFVDNNQMIRPSDIGGVKEIKRVADIHGAEVTELELTAQFRCAGAEGYVNWLDDVLHIQETANYDGWENEDFDFKIFDDPNDLHAAIKEKHKKGHTARTLAGYAWRWTSAKQGNPDAEIEDVEIPEFDFCKPWNTRKARSTWVLEDDTIDQIGCIHTTQGLEFDYVGVIVGNDLKFDPEELEYYTEWGEYKDRAGKKGLKNKPDKLNRLVRNIYKILLSRGQKGCYVFFRDKRVEEYFKER